MRPLYLEMTAFGSYAEKTALPFEELRHGLYLVTGDTGAGKTTIFDAIMFALFGVASGADRKTDMLHCDYVPKSTDTRVKLRFAQNGKEYTVERRIHFSKKRGTAEQYQDATVDALLTEPDAAPIEGARKVTERCEALLGLNAEQFGRIIMLAQGEFKKFLKADSDEKNEILGKLFDNSVYVYYQDLLFCAKEELGRHRAADEEELRGLMERSFQRPESFRGEEGEAFLPGHPGLIANLDRLIAEESEELERWRKERDEALDTLGEISRQQGESRAMNALLEELEREQRRLDGLEALDGEMAERRIALERTDRALHRALPAVVRAEQAETDLRLDLAEIEDLKDDLFEISRALTAAETAAQADQDAEREKRELENRIHSIEEQLPRFEALRQRERERDLAERKRGEAEQQRKAEEKRQEQLSEELGAMHRQLDDLEGVDAALASCRNEAAKAAERLDALEGKAGLKSELAAIRRMEAELEAEKDTLLRLTRSAGEKAELADALYQQFIAAQAALLADELRQTLTEHDETVCPVCGTRVRREQSDRLARLPDETPGKEAVDDARQSAARAERRRSEQDAAVQARSATVLARKQSAAERAGKLLPGCDSWDALRAPGFLDAAILTAREAAEAGRAALAAAQERLAARDQLRKALPDRELELQAAQDRIARCQQDEQSQRSLSRAAEAAIQVLKTQLSFADRAAAETERARLTERVGSLARQIRAHQEALASARSRRDTVLGSLTEKENAAEKLTLARDEAVEERERVLEQSGFEDAEAVRSCLAPLAERDAEQWIRTERRTLSEHEINKNSSRELIRTRRAQTEGRQTVDLELLEARRLELNERYARVNDRCTGRDALLKNHHTVRDRADALKRALADSDGAWKRLEKLSSLAKGASSESGKLSFDRYVMGAMFREILEMANRRMELMSGGRYVLVHRIGADRKNAKAGLEIEVLDNNTGLQRASGSLSGGESFFTSLALALGLSDVVQNHAGGRQMDALFIDEGFGSLSDDVLDKALDVLNQLTEGNRLVGIISHVDKLDESIAQKVRVRHSEKGSSLSLELA